MENNYMTVNVVYHLKQLPHTIGYGRLPSHKINIDISKKDLLDSIVDGKIEGHRLIKSKLRERGIFWSVIDNPSHIKKTIEDRLNNPKIEEFSN